MANRVIGIGIAGLDHWYSAVPFIKAVVERDDVRVVAVTDRDEERARAVCRDIDSHIAVVNSLAELLEAPGLDVVASFVRPRDNPEVCVAAAAGGKHVMSAKPMAVDLAGGEAIRDAVTKAGVAFLPAESKWRERAEYRLLRDYVASGRLGTVISAHLIVAASVPKVWPNLEDPGWFTDPRLTFGGGWADHAIYQVDQVRWLLSDEVESVQGISRNLLHKGMPVEDYGHAILTMATGAVACLDCGWTSPAGWRAETSIVGTRGSVRIDSTTGRVSLLEPDLGITKDWLHFAVPSDPVKLQGLDTLLGLIDKTGNTPILGVGDAWDNLSACLAFYDAAKSGGRVRPVHLEV